MVDILSVATATTTPGAPDGTTAAPAAQVVAPLIAPVGAGGTSRGTAPPLHPPPPPPAVVGNVLPKNCLEYYNLRRDLDPPMEGVMDMFKAAQPHMDLAAPVRTYDKLNDEILDTKDSNHHGYVMITNTDSKLLVLHRLSFHATALGVATEAWHQKLFAFTGDIVGDQMPQTICKYQQGPWTAYQEPSR
jgi:hypothetical protein